MERILIANRGEIAVRLIRACRSLQKSPVTVYSTEDNHSLHIRMADDAISLGSGNLSKTYMNTNKIIEAAKKANVDAIHPGYSFLSDNGNFAQNVIDEGFIWIGPNPDTLHMIENKLEAKKLAKSAGFKILPDSEIPIEDLNHAKRVAKDLNYPIIIKPCYGSGGLGIEIVKRGDQLENAIRKLLAQSEILADNAYFIEPYISNLQMFELGFLADNNNHTVCFPEREITIQYHAQKFFCESPSTFLSNEDRNDLYKMINEFISKINFNSLGNIEFFAKQGLGIVFDEINPHIQLEHPLTEIITGIDMPVEQISCSLGNDLRISQNEVTIENYAMQFRINAEDPLNSFQPSTGRVKEVEIPGGPWVRFDTNIYRGYEIPLLYDTYLGQLLVVSNISRETTRRRALSALKELTISGIPTTIDYHRHLISHPDFITGKFSTNFVDKQSDIIRALEEELRATIAALFTVRKETSKVILPPLSKSRWRDSVRNESIGRGV